MKLKDFYNFNLVSSLDTVRSNKYFDVKYENKEYRVSLDRTVPGLVAIEKFNGNYWVDFDHYNYFKDASESDVN